MTPAENKAVEILRKKNNIAYILPDVEIITRFKDEIIMLIEMWNAAIDAAADVSDIPMEDMQEILKLKHNE